MEINTEINYNTESSGAQLGQIFNPQYQSSHDSDHRNDMAGSHSAATGRPITAISRANFCANVASDGVIKAASLFRGGARPPEVD